jgi:hypothetical protein
MYPYVLFSDFVSKATRLIIEIQNIGYPFVAEFCKVFILECTFTITKIRPNMCEGRGHYL